MSDNATSARKTLRQHAMTARLMGVEFLPVKLAAPVDSITEHDRGDEPPQSRPAPAQELRPTRGVDVLYQLDAGRAASPGKDRFAPRHGLTRQQKIAALEELRARHAATCPHCTQAEGWNNLVFADGDPDAALMFIGEAPGADEDATGIPFVGAAGKKLNDMIGAMGLSREAVYIANVLKARPPGNRTPTPEEAANCGPFLKEQIAIVSPRVIVTLGNPAMHYVLNTTRGIMSVRGNWFTYQGIPVMPTYHPSFLLRQYTPENRKAVWSDLQQVVAKLKELGAM